MAGQKEQLTETCRSGPSGFWSEEGKDTNINLPAGAQEADDWPYYSLLPNETIHVRSMGIAPEKAQIQ